MRGKTVRDKINCSVKFEKLKRFKKERKKERKKEIKKERIENEIEGLSHRRSFAWQEKVKQVITMEFRQVIT